MPPSSATLSGSGSTVRHGLAVAAVGRRAARAQPHTAAAVAIRDNAHNATIRRREAAAVTREADRDLCVVPVAESAAANSAALENRSAGSLCNAVATASSSCDDTV